MINPAQGEIKGCILIVDDEPLMTDLFTQLVGRRGYRVITAQDAKSAICMVETYKHEISIIITDLSMPGMDGLDLSRALLNIAPGIPVLVATGYDTEFKSIDTPSNVVGVINKPYKTKTILETISTIIDVHELP